jgi:hypothetical protein
MSDQHPEQASNGSDDAVRSGGIDNNANPYSSYLRAFTLGFVWFAAVGVKMVSRHPNHWSTYPPRNFIVLVVAWIITALLLGALAARWKRLRSWSMVALATVAGSFVVMGSMLLLVEQIRGPAAATEFKDRNAMMEHFANEAAKWVKQDRGIVLDYSLDSIKVVEEELERISKEVNRDNPQQGTWGTALGFGAYIGEVFRRSDGGDWAVNHPNGGPQSYPLTIQSNVTIFPVGWCWRRLTLGAEDNVYHKAMMCSQAASELTNTVPNEVLIK